MRSDVCQLQPILLTTLTVRPQQITGTFCHDKFLNSEVSRYDKLVAKP